MENNQAIEQFLTTRTEEAFGALFEAVCTRVRRYFILRGLDVATAEDLTQNVFLKVYRQAGELRDSDHFFGWLFAIARNEMISFWRREQSRPTKVEFEPLDHQLPNTLVVESGIYSSLLMMDLLRLLDPADRDLVVLRFVEGLSYEELALALNLPLGTIKWRLFNARKVLAQLISASPTASAQPRIN
ncbi:MAG TPA: RNA polymerase sigma factor [Blastocatellia bacterium]|nr:RNA polymerase sigma factor [Blastocatellia bacterium]